MNIVFIVSAPSGSGKSTLVQRLMAEVPRLSFSISYTTRAPRGSEQHGDSYYFVSRDEFEQRMKNGEFLEHAEVFGNYYGTHRDQITRAGAKGHDLILDIDVKGAAQVREKQDVDSVSIFVLAPSREVLEQRLRSRGEDRAEVIEKRLRGAVTEIEDYGCYDYVIVNDDLEEAALALQSIVRAERVKRSRMAERVRPILKTFGVDETG